ncbi:MAG: glycosyl hydrolase [Verrucomicrobia bacterium RIFCSPLOWO2_12_FULL_64_8]|nr:MAG: glycosyl hydrolase [Verrucomicrobia bacterium RIFCSPLOWO2_12_FULL_64_8]
MKPLRVLLLGCVLAPTWSGLLTSLGAAAGDGWISLFDGKTLDGWRASENQGTFTVAGGELIAHGKRSHLFYEGPVAGHRFTNFEFRAEVLTKPGANSGVYFHTEYQETGWPAKGYEVQVNNTHSDPRKTAGLYAVQDNFKSPAKDDEWFTLHIKVEGKRILTKVNGRVIADYTQEESPARADELKGRVLSSGTFAIQGHDPKSEVRYRNILVRPLP